MKQNDGACPCKGCGTPWWRNCSPAGCMKMFLERPCLPTTREEFADRFMDLAVRGERIASCLNFISSKIWTSLMANEYCPLSKTSFDAHFSLKTATRVVCLAAVVFTVKCGHSTIYCRAAGTSPRYTGLHTALMAYHSQHAEQIAGTQHPCWSWKKGFL